MARKTDCEFAMDTLAAHTGETVFEIRAVERIEDEDEDVVHISGEIETAAGDLGYFSIPEHWPEGTTVNWQ